MREQGWAHLEHNHGPDETAPERPSTHLLLACGWEWQQGSGRMDGRIEWEHGCVEDGKHAPPSGCAALPEVAG